MVEAPDPANQPAQAIADALVNKRIRETSTYAIERWVRAVTNGVDGQVELMLRCRGDLVDAEMRIGPPDSSEGQITPT